jgi:hypothetical protein
MTYFSISLSLPYSPSDFTKNRAHVLRRAPKSKLGVGVGRSDASRRLIDQIALEVRSAVNSSPTQPHNCRTGINVTVFKSTWQSDAINVIDSLADGVKVGLGVDDHWFYIHRLNWLMVPSGSERLLLTIFQEDVEDCWWCSRCRAYIYKKELDKSGRCISCRPSRKKE